jgi:ethylbenzene dioxygenase subunit beta
MMSSPLQHRVEQFLYREARLLDQGDYWAWEALFADDGLYWVPLTHGQTDPLNHASIFYEDAILRDVRIRRLAQPHAWSQDPPTRTARIVGNVMVLAESAEALQIGSTFQMVEWRKRREQRLLAGSYTHDLVPDGDSFKIKLKRVDLINCDGIQDPFEVFI